jgi:periplasmic protein CpxP/Spy
MRLKRTNRIIALVALLGALALAAIAVFAQQGPPFGGHGGPDGHGPIPFARELNLTDAQKAQIKQIMDNFMASTKDLHDKLKALHESAPDPLSTTFDEAAVRSAAQARANIEVELEVAHVKAMSQVFALLTDEQKAQLAAHRKEFEQHRGEFEHHRDAPPPPPPAGEDVPLSN